MDCSCNEDYWIEAVGARWFSTNQREVALVRWPVKFGDSGTEIEHFVGQRGVRLFSHIHGAGGGGGTFVVADSNNTPLIVAGGGGGASQGMPVLMLRLQTTGADGSSQ